ncbi:MAG: hypothetical protein SGBAC_011538 [Bacillariaceae sp.]
MLRFCHTASAYTCTFSGQVRHDGRPSLLCRHGTKSSSGVFDARRITILYLQTEDEGELDLPAQAVESSSNQDYDDDGDDEGTNLQQTTKNVKDDLAATSKREKLKRLLKRMKGLAPTLRICLPKFMARIRSIESELYDGTNGTNGTSSLRTKGRDDELGDKEAIEVEEEEEEETDDRSVTAASHVDLSGTWRPIVTPQFKVEYDQYLQNCSQSFMFRKVVVNGISLQKETIHQLEDGTDLQIIASNPAGNWNRTLVASSSKDPANVTMQDPDGDTVQVEAWWENDGKVHKSWLRNKPRLLGGAFETARYLSEEDPNILMCDSIFHPAPDSPPSKGFKYGRVMWQFRREA